MYARILYAVNNTAKKLDAVFRTKSEYEIALAFMVTIGAFVVMQIAINHDIGDVFTQFIVGCAIATVFS